MSTGLESAHASVDVPVTRYLSECATPAAVVLGWLVWPGTSVNRKPPSQMMSWDAFVDRLPKLRLPVLLVWQAGVANVKFRVFVPLMLIPRMT